ncbi:unnamed protein product [Brassica rapa subsp. trilocularis]
MTEKWCVRKLVMPSVVKINEGELRFHLFGFLMCIAATGARALKSMLQGILHSSEGVRHGCTVAVMVLSKFYVSKVGIF